MEPSNPSTNNLVNTPSNPISQQLSIIALRPEASNVLAADVATLKAQASGRIFGALNNDNTMK